MSEREGTIRADLVTVMVDREETSRLIECELVEYAKVRRDFPEYFETRS